MSNTSYPLTHNMQVALNNARRIAEQNRHPSIDSLALLLALLQLPKSQVPALLTHLKVRVDNLTARVSATIKLEAGEAAVSSEGTRSGATLSADTESVLRESLNEMKDRAFREIDENILLLGMLRTSDSKAGQILAQYGVTAEQAREGIKTVAELPQSSFSIKDLLKAMGRAMRHGVSPIFISLILFAATMTGFLWFGIGNNPKVFMFAFIISGWLVSLCLHEFGHAVTAFWCGDESVENKGYLTLNPLKYTHPVISVVIPVVMLLMGGLAFPGGAVYINIQALRKPVYRSFVSAAGPLANLICLFLLALPFGNIPFLLFYSNAPSEFLSALGVLALLQMISLFINLLPIPGLDGFGILEPFLPRELLEFTGFLRPFGFLIVFFLLSVDSPIADFFWNMVWSAMQLLGFNLAYFANEGVKIFFP